MGGWKTTLAAGVSTVCLGALKGRPYKICPPEQSHCSENALARYDFQLRCRYVYGIATHH
jgi:hypothetical protein